ncbi:synaptonemal complex central element protein 2 [Gallus gallus]|uniref:Synaptonemal complex central element protein 2 n=1 Tax=Gallus gallus TaxID=9031 RepID=A0A8V0X9F0_CHICK|nr:synaptonemal complex central element protein 2 [Gallus gallus]XP_025001599.1 synaptonemal complex central element protein 2 [Gallus gallus]XP_040549023.1 synaptonemal complex central element protein 2 [Gallus gallus]XP_040549024.1 synaptonemal complex central element protein 2 [Gallus gallus]XP_046760728.1 synaptonemal complex central element protein 2 [Gallus gallus]XP_046789986.1 synaptonemal complex central element protein 2 [Gallus gallus]|eukprot:XP_003643433.1 synaptonemal complex central element protein 2 [Gallus gallus]
MTSHHPNVSTALQDNEAALQEPEETQNDTACCPGPGREKAHEESSRVEARGAAVLDRQASSRYFAALDSSVGDLRQRAQGLIDRLNDSRKEDHTVMSGFRDSLQLEVSNLAEQLEERLFQLYSLHNELIQERLQELAEVMERVRQAEDELQQVCHTVEAAYRDLCLQPET